MKSFRASESEFKQLQMTARLLKDANLNIATSTKAADAAKEGLAKWLRDERQLDLNQLAIGEMVMIEGVLLVEIGKQNKFDEKGFQIDQPATHAKYKKDVSIRKFKPL